MGYTPHTGTHRGKRVKVRLRTGEEFIDNFHERTDKYVFFRSGRKVLRREIKAFSIIKRA